MKIFILIALLPTLALADLASQNAEMSRLIDQNNQRMSDQLEQDSYRLSERMRVDAELMRMEDEMLSIKRSIQTDNEINGLQEKLIYKKQEVDVQTGSSASSYEGYEPLPSYLRSTVSINTLNAGDISQFETGEGVDGAIRTKFLVGIEYLLEMVLVGFLLIVCIGILQKKQ